MADKDQSKYLLHHVSYKKLLPTRLTDMYSKQCIKRNAVLDWKKPFFCSVSFAQFIHVPCLLVLCTSTTFWTHKLEKHFAEIERWNGMPFIFWWHSKYESWIFRWPGQDLLDNRILLLTTWFSRAPHRIGPNTRGVFFCCWICEFQKASGMFLCKPEEQIQTQHPTRVTVELCS